MHVTLDPKKRCGPPTLFLVASAIGINDPQDPDIPMLDLLLGNLQPDPEGRCSYGLEMPVANWVKLLRNQDPEVRRFVRLCSLLVWHNYLSVRFITSKGEVLRSPLIPLVEQ